MLIQGDIFLAMKRFVILNDLQVEAPLCDDGVIYDDPVMSVQGISFQKYVCRCRFERKF